MSRCLRQFSRYVAGYMCCKSLPHFTHVLLRYNSQSVSQPVCGRYISLLTSGSEMVCDAFKEKTIGSRFFAEVCAQNEQMQDILRVLVRTIIEMYQEKHLYGIEVRVLRFPLVQWDLQLNLSNRTFSQTILFTSFRQLPTLSMYCQAVLFCVSNFSISEFAKHIDTSTRFRFKHAYRA